jgi:undecaprenyl pyrophosphate synthase
MKTRKPPTSGGYLSALVHTLFAHLTSLLIFIVSLGPIPKHVAFVMDGNRRYARGKGQKVGQGHTEGFESLKRVSLIASTRLGLMCRYWKYA